jgi:serine/threonine-protein kinase
MDLLGKTLGQYQLIEVIHQGENTVYKGFQPAANRDVAVKVLPPARARDRVFVQQFRQDMELISSLKHPNILPLYTYGRQEGLLFLVSPYIKTGTLRNHLPQYYTPALAQQIVNPVASALDYIHSQGAIHGNLKPSNVLISPQRQPLLADFGVSQGLDLGGRDDAYLSPEQLQDGLVDWRTDIYALGALLYRMVVGETPPVGGGPSPRLKRPDLPIEVEQVILQAMAQYPEQRFQSAGALSQALEAALAAPVVVQPVEPVVAVPPAAASAAEPARSTYWLPLLLGVALVCVLGFLCTGAIAYVGLVSQDSTESPVLLPIFSGDATATPAEVPNPTVQPPEDQPVREAIIEPIDPEPTEEPPTPEPTQEPAAPEPTQEAPTPAPAQEVTPEQQPNGTEGG